MRSPATKTCEISNTKETHPIGFLSFWQVTPNVHSKITESKSPQVFLYLIIQTSGVGGWPRNINLVQAFSWRGSLLPRSHIAEAEATQVVPVLQMKILDFVISWFLTWDIWDLFKAKEPPILPKENPDRNIRFWGKVFLNKSLDDNWGIDLDIVFSDGNLFLHLWANNNRGPLKKAWPLRQQLVFN